MTQASLGFRLSCPVLCPAGTHETEPSYRSKVHFKGCYFNLFIIILPGFYDQFHIEMIQVVKNNRPELHGLSI